MRVPARPVVLLGALALVGAALLARPEAGAVAPDDVVGVYKLKLKGDGWVRGTTQPYRAERIGGTATLFVARAPTADGKLHVEIRLESSLTGGVLDLATPATAFVGEAHLVGDSLTLIDTGAPTYVNALTLQFAKEGARLSGHWIAAYPASEAGATASGAGLSFNGRRLGKPGKPNARDASAR